MGIFALCPAQNLDISVSYDIVTEPQGMIYVVYGSFCILCELTFLYVTIKFFGSNIGAFKRTYFVLLYLTFHLSLICYILYFFGGFICYGAALYNTVANLPYLFQGVGMYCIIMEMLDSLFYLSQLKGNVSSLNHLHFLPIIVLYSMGFAGMLVWDVSGGALSYFFLYNVIWYTFFLCSFFIAWRSLNKEMLLMYRSCFSNIGMSKWLTVVHTIMLLMFIRGLLALLNFVKLTYYLKENYLSLFTVYMIVFITVFALGPCVVLTIFLQLRLQPTIVQKVPESITRTPKRFTESTKNSLAELLDYENAEEELN